MSSVAETIKDRKSRGVESLARASFFACARKWLRLPVQIGALLRHPANRGHCNRALRRWLAWQIGARLVPGAVAAPFVDDALMLMSPGLAGATGNIHFGLAEYADMAFALHLLRPYDLFVDVGANIGAYSILAAAAGARVIAFEPVDAAAALLERNIGLNNFGARITLHRKALGADAGETTMTLGLDAMNHVSLAGESGGRVKMETLDAVLGAAEATLIKIDVEGFEPAVLRGAANALARESLLAVIVEVTGAYRAYGFTREDVEAPLRAQGFLPYVYEPESRRLDPGLGSGGNIIFVRDADAARARLQGARQFGTLAGVV